MENIQNVINHYKEEAKNILMDLLHIPKGGKTEPKIDRFIEVIIALSMLETSIVMSTAMNIKEPERVCSEEELEAYAAKVFGV